VGRVCRALSENLDAALACGFGHFLHSHQHPTLVGTLMFFLHNGFVDGWPPPGALDLLLTALPVHGPKSQRNALRRAQHASASWHDPAYQSKDLCLNGPGGEKHRPQAGKVPEGRKHGQNSNVRVRGREWNKWKAKLGMRLSRNRGTRLLWSFGYFPTKIISFQIWSQRPSCSAEPGQGT